jgi:sugar/nucleoside kinase (ribokinase family)
MTQIRAGICSGENHRGVIISWSRHEGREGASLSAAIPKPIVLCTIGDLILDVVVLPNRVLAADGDTPATIRLGAGGQAANVAAWASALGATSRIICKRGSDTQGKLVTAELESYGVEVRGPAVPGRSGVVVSVREASGQRTMASDRGVAPLLDPDELDTDWVATADVLHVSGYCLFHEPMAAAAIKAAASASRVTVDLSSAQGIRNVGVERFCTMLVSLKPDLVFATETERATIPNFRGAWVTKLGPRGAIFPEGAYPARSTEPVDTTGAGDALAAGYLVGGPEMAMEAAARCVSLVGAMPSGGFDKSVERADACNQ